MIRRILLASAGAMALADAALAADLSSIPPPPPPVFSWTGFYVGGNLGFGGDRFIYPFTAGVVSGQATLTSEGIIGGGQVGFNWQFPNNFLLGLETDFDGASIRGKATVNIATPGVFSAQAGSRINYIGTVRGRVGYAWDRFLIYGTGGFAYGQVNASASAGIISIGENDGRTGWTAGGGVEYAILSNLTFKTEYLYVDLGKNTIFNGTFGAGININQKTTANIVRAGVNYKFNWWTLGPIVAKY